jgi:hypothetical protein
MSDQQPFNPAEGGYRIVFAAPPNFQTPQYGGRRRPIPPQDHTSEAEEAAWIKYMEVLTEQEKQEVERLKIVNMQEKLRVDQQINNLWMQGLGEIRTAIGGAKVEEGNPGIGDNRPLQLLFDEINDGRLQQRYLAMLDTYLKTMKVEVPNK